MNDKTLPLEAHEEIARTYSRVMDDLFRLESVSRGGNERGLLTDVTATRVQTLCSQIRRMVDDVRATYMTVLYHDYDRNNDDIRGIYELTRRHLEDALDDNVKPVELDDDPDPDVWGGL